MNKLLFLCLAFVLSCKTNVSDKSSQDLKPQILITSSQGGGDSEGFVIIRDQQQLLAEVAKRNTVEDGSKSAYPAISDKNKIIIYDLGSFSSGDHRITEIKKASVENNVLTLEVPEYKSGGMEIMMVSNPWMLISVPSEKSFTSIKLTYSKL
ncbi:hypothetical protein [Chryseobacterium caseinilyticum]|uniref:Uncharacterized protein n=1 Tax=Chryseobacterium caseinilyticum TaxID=2771428 RepID=A0ABR8ZC12_9FLAO|nr:hypothetical protein [Chryseobacterium caseinilyticum]MBD8082788.1 hypothetical protein [Chryseobacterium caseinilyticum]